jgi:rhamnose transport system permease protein
VGSGFELDVITIVLLGGVSIFGGKGTLVGTLLSILIVLNLRNGMGLMNITGHIQTGVIGLLLIASVVIPRIKFATSRGPKPEATS